MLAPGHSTENPTDCKAAVGRLHTGNSKDQMIDLLALDGRSQMTHRHNARRYSGGWAMNFDLKQFYLSARGRVNRKQWWLRLILPLFILSIVLTLIDVALGTYSSERGGGVLGGLFGLAVLIPCILAHIKRWHDRDKSGWWMLILFVPIVGAIWFLIELGFLPGTPGPNCFGQPPTD